MGVKPHTMRLALGLATLLLLLPARAPGLTCKDPELRSLKFCDHRLPVETRVADLLPRLNLTQRLGQFSGTAPAIPELGMAEYNYGGEALHGIWSDCVNSSAGELKCPTQFGSPLAMSCSFNRRLWRAMASATSTEIRAFYDAAAADPLNASSSAKSLEGLPFGLSYYTPNINSASFFVRLLPASRPRAPMATLTESSRSVSLSPSFTRGHCCHPQSCGTRDGAGRKRCAPVSGTVRSPHRSCITRSSFHRFR